MNERIYQLQGQAKILAEQHIAHRKFDDVMEYRQVLYDTTMNKFAELIILEANYWIHRRIGPKTALDFLEHFGVSE